MTGERGSGITGRQCLVIAIVLVGVPAAVWWLSEPYIPAIPWDGIAKVILALVIYRWAAWMADAILAHLGRIGQAIEALSAKVGQLVVSAQDMAESMRNEERQAALDRFRSYMMNNGFSARDCSTPEARADFDKAVLDLLRIRRDD